MPLSFTSDSGACEYRSNEQERAVTGDRKPRESQTHHQHLPHRAADEHEAERTSQQRNRGRRSSGGGTPKNSNYRFDDQLEHDMCQLVTHCTPNGFPVYYRSELATMPPVEVARTDDRILFCDLRHSGPHIWPNGDVTSSTRARESHERT